MRLVSAQQQIINSIQNNEEEVEEGKNYKVTDHTDID